jgi:hypothetical protein
VLQAIRSLPAPKDISRDAGALDTEEDGGSTPPAPTFTPSTSAFGSSRTSLDNGGRSGPRRWSPSSCASELAQHAPRLRCQHQVALLVIQPQCTSLRPGETPIGTALSPRLPIGMRSQVQVLAGHQPPQQVRASPSSRRSCWVAALPLVPVALCWCSRPSHQQRQTAHGQQSHAQGDGQAAAKDPYSRPRPPFNHHGVRFLPGRDRSG